MKSRNIYLLLFISLTILSCMKEESFFTVPYSRVNFRVDLNGVDSDLTPFSFKTFERARYVNEYTGFGGLLIFRSVEGKIFAYDLACPHEDDKNTLVEPRNNGTAYCNKCGTTYITMFGEGTVDSGVSEESLQKYKVNVLSLSLGQFSITN